MANAAVYYGLQLGKETTPGTGVTAAKALTGISGMAAQMTEADAYGPDGRKYNTSGGIKKVWGALTMKGRASYSDIVYLLAGLIVSPTVTGSNPYTWTFVSNPASPDAFAAFTAQAGSTGQPVFKSVYTILSDFTLSVDDNAANVSAKAFGARPTGVELWTPTGTMDTVGTTIAPVPAMRTHWTLKGASSYAGLSGASVLPFRKAELKVEGKIKPAWFVDGTADYTAPVEGKTKVGLSLDIELSNTNAALFANARAGDTRFFKLAAASGTNSITCEFAGIIASTPEPKSDDGVMVMSLELDGIADSNMNNAPFKIVVVNAVSAL